MVRRRAAKKGPAAKGGKPRKDDASVAKWNTAADIPMEDEDEFHTSRDQILLEGEDDDDDGLGQEDEVFGLQGLSEDDDDEEDDEDEDMEGEGDDLADDVPSPNIKASKKEKGKKGKKAAAPSPSASEDESEEETWGRGKKAYYASNADEIDSEDEEAHEMEEQEARRLQGKALEVMTDADFGLEDDDAVGGENDSEDVALTVAEVSQLPKDTIALVKHLEKTDPEALALTRDWEDTAYNLAKAKQNIAKLEEEESEMLSLGMMHLYYQTLLTYASTLAFYIHLRASPKYARNAQLLQAHPIFARLLTLKQALATLDELDFAPPDSDEDELDDGEEDSLLYGSDDEDEELSDDDVSNGKPRVGRVGFAELSDLLAEAEEAGVRLPKKSIAPSKIPVPSSKKPATAPPDTDAPPKKKRKTATRAEPVFDLVEPEFVPSSSKSAASKAAATEEDPTSAHGEPSLLPHADLEDKRARKRTLRFYTSRIESKSARREGARQAALGGDDDLPYRERRKDKESREAREAQKKALGQGGADLDGVDVEGGEGGDAMDVDGGEDGEDADGYYDLVKRASRAKKAQKKAAHDAEVAERRAELEGMDVDSADGPRGLTRAIMANKGLTPRRAKSVRNPRVKKRQKFEKAQRKVASQRAVYKGGLAATGGRYEGEKSGISKVVKSVKLS
ncbi:Sas10 C-terminal domain-containing protein [Schizophyllum amplum]|uniref:Sas10 C-terminal domain-containing protein n=1 Tax=Schizophyllum amplum TaxID=97359 RepID=A0A550CGP5_9AGAR|nr:Sas10 C-terminal domain-containing protein [Auriculariopsis ampla]